MKSLSRILVSLATACAFTAGAPLAAAQSSQTPQEQQQWRTDPVGALAWSAIMSSHDILRADEFAFSVASMYSIGDSTSRYTGSMAELDRCARAVTFYNPTQAARFVGAGFCLLSNPGLKERIREESWVQPF